MAKKKRAPARPDIELGRPGGVGTDPDALGLGVAVSRTASGAAYFRPRSIMNLSAEAAQVVAALQRAAIHRAEVDASIDELVLELRDLGASWAAIGWSVGTTGEAARQRWGERAEQQ